MAKLTKTEIARLHPETLALSYGYDPNRSEGAIKTPIFLTSTFGFKSAEEGKKLFSWALGNEPAPPKETMGLIYSRLNNPNLEILEDRLALWEGMNRAFTFSSGMAAITTVLFALHQPGDEIIVLVPIYGGSNDLANQILNRYQINAKIVPAGPDAPKAIEKIISKKTRSIFFESPANPNNRLTDIEAIKKIAKKNSSKERPILVLVDNTLAGPVFSRPAQFGADIVFYSATKFIGGHSDLVAGVALFNDENIIKEVAHYRAVFGGMPNPYTAWLMTRSLETLQIRMEKQQENAKLVAAFLTKHPKVKKVYYLGLLKEKDPEYAIYKKQYTGPGSLISFDIKGNEKSAFEFLNQLKIFKLAVSLGSTESLAQHPFTMTHASVSTDIKKIAQVTESMIRLSIGLEHHEDLMWDLSQALDAVK